jgi:light-regulated signal transduction histidine kinase (bacteriophytochrome)
MMPSVVPITTDRRVARNATNLRAPLRAIRAFTEILIADYGAQLPDDAQGLLDKVTASSRRMEQLIDDLLRLSRLGRQPLFKLPCSMSNLVRDVTRDLRGEETASHVELIVRDLPDCVGDPSLLRQVFANLLSNAIKFTRHKRPAVVEVGSGRLNSADVYYVRDNGAGFDMSLAQGLFGVFQRFHPADEFEGNGVGLSIVQNIIQRHGGRIWAEAEVDKGATFSFILPAPLAEKGAFGPSERDTLSGCLREAAKP